LSNAKQGKKKKNEARQLRYADARLLAWKGKPQTIVVVVVVVFVVVIEHYRENVPKNRMNPGICVTLMSSSTPHYPA
jgi:hypothetical protein